MRLGPSLSVLLATMLAICLAPRESMANTVEGIWQSSSGNRFDYWDTQRQYTGTFSPQDPDRIRVAGGSQVTWWRRAVDAQPAAPTPPPPSASSQDCWDGTDPGCGRRKNGFLAAGRVSFAAALAIVRSARNNLPLRLTRAKQAVTLLTLTARQVATLLLELKPRHDLMLELVRVCAPKIVNPERSDTVGRIFGTDRRAKAQAIRIVESYRVD